MMKKGFQDIPGHPGYIVNESGYVYSEKSNIFLPWTPNIKDYPRVELWTKGEQFRYFVHRIVATVFVHNPDPKNKIEVNHNDFDKWNPSADNLCWMTPEENRKYNRHKIKYTLARFEQQTKDIYCPF
jgi:hypothetical protein